MDGKNGWSGFDFTSTILPFKVLETSDGTNASVYKIKNERVKESDKRIEQKIGALLLQFLGNSFIAQIQL